MFLRAHWIGMFARLALLSLVSLVSLFSTTGCRTRLLEPGDRDMALGDGPPPAIDQGACARHRLVPVPISEIHPLDPGQLDPGQIRYGSIIRVLLGVPLRPCEAFGDVQTRVMPGNATDFVVVTVRVWRSDVDCGPQATQFRTLHLTQFDGLSSPLVLVGDGAPGGTQRLTLSVKPPPMGASCNMPVTIGGRCQLDCQCQKADATARCILDSPDRGSCQIPCEEDADCPAGSNSCASNLDYTCRAASSSQCLSSCPYGQSCDQGGCRPLAGSRAGMCHCDADCGAGTLCGEARSCVTPCTTNADCDTASRTPCIEGQCADLK